MNKGMAIIELLIGFLVLTMIIACFLKTSIIENENMQIQKAKQEILQNTPKQNVKTVEIEIDDDEEEDIPMPHKIKDTSLIPQFLEVLD